LEVFRGKKKQTTAFVPYCTQSALFSFLWLLSGDGSRLEFTGDRVFRRAYKPIPQCLEFPAEPQQLAIPFLDFPLEKNQ